MDQSIFKENDIRGVYPTQLNEQIIYQIAQAYAAYFSPKKVVVGMDVRLSSPALHQALIEGLLDAGVDVLDLGLTSIEQLYFTVGFYIYSGGLMVTASHNPKEFNGLKMVSFGVDPVDEEKIKAIKDLIKEERVKVEKRGHIEKLDIFDDYKEYLFKFVNLNNLKPLKIVANANFGYQGQVVLKILKDLPIEISLLNGEPDGSFPKGRPDPFIPSTRIEFLKKIKTEKADFGVAWDADADRVFFASGDGEFIEAYYTSALLIKHLLENKSNQKVIYDGRYIWATIDTVQQMGGEPIISKVGHTFIKYAMREHNAIFCGEASGHNYFRDYFFCESGILPLLMIIELISKSSQTLKELIAPLKDKYFISGEINFAIQDFERVLIKVKELYEKGAKVDEFDGVSFEYEGEWRFNLRHSHTENLVRLNLEATNEKLLAEKKEELVKFFSTFQ